MNDHLINELAHARLADLHHTAHQTVLARTARARCRGNPPTLFRLIVASYAFPYRRAQTSATIALPRKTNQ
jgi:hypothetical protein